MTRLLWRWHYRHTSRANHDYAAEAALKVMREHVAAVCGSETLRTALDSGTLAMTHGTIRKAVSVAYGNAQEDA